LPRSSRGTGLTPVPFNMNVWTRLKLAEGASPGLAEQAMS
jgi:hypothetical protein